MGREMEGKEEAGVGRGGSEMEGNEEAGADARGAGWIGMVRSEPVVRSIDESKKQEEN